MSDSLRNISLLQFITKGNVSVITCSIVNLQLIHSWQWTAMNKIYKLQC